jgi:hypothetical protein
MEYNNIKVHQPWYARGTPDTNPRDGPAMALSDKPLFAIRIGPSARGEPPDFPRPWLIFKTVFVNTQKWVFGQSYAQIHPLAEDKIMANEMIGRQEIRQLADETIIGMYMSHAPKIRQLADDKIIETNMMCAAKIRQLADDKIIALENHSTLKPRRGDKIVANAMVSAPKIRQLADDMIIEKSMIEQQKYHPFGVSVQHRDLCYNPTIRQRRIENQIHHLADDMIIANEIKIAKNQTQRVDMIIEIDIMCAPKSRRGAMIIAMYMIGWQKPRRGGKIIENAMIRTPKIRQLADDTIMGKSMNVGQKYHPLRVSVHHYDLCYNPTIRQKRIENQIHPFADENQIQRGKMIIF